MTKPTLAKTRTKANIKGFIRQTKPGRNKGGRGQKVELSTGIPNSTSLTDGEDFEQKTFTKGQTIKVTMLKHCLSGILEQDLKFEESNVGIKLEQTWYIGYDKEGKFIGETVVNSATDGVHYKQLKEDYEYIASEVKECYHGGVELRTTTGPNGLLQIRTAASKNSSGGYTPLEYKKVVLKDKAMAFYLCGKFGRELFN